MRFIVDSLEDWQIVAQALVKKLEPGVLILLSGTLGAGKTTLTQVIARELGIEGRIKSPTFALLRTYPLENHGALKKLVHIDAYRLENADDVLSLGLEEVLKQGDAAIIIEWPEQMGEWLDKTTAKKVKIEISLTEGEKREVTISD